MENLDIHAEETDLERARRLLSEPANTVLLLRTNQALVELIQGKPHAEILEALTATVTEEETNHASETALGKSL